MIANIATYPLWNDGEPWRKLVQESKKQFWYDQTRKPCVIGLLISAYMINAATDPMALISEEFADTFEDFKSDLKEQSGNFTLPGVMGPFQDESSPVYRYTFYAFPVKPEFQPSVIRERSLYKDNPCSEQIG